MTADELLTELLKLTPEQLDFPVEMEGCDCYGELDRVELDHGVIYLRRV